MQTLKDRISREGENLGRGILKIDSFLNHQIDPALMVEAGQIIAQRFAAARPTRILTAEVSGIIPAIMAGMEGTRPVLTELQALVSPSPLGTPRRAVVGFDSNRLAMILAVLEARAGLRIGAHDVYLNVAGGLKVREPAADLAAAAALVSSLHGAPLPAQAVLFGEIALSGAVRPVGQSSTTD